MKRSRKIVLALSGTLAAGALTGCNSSSYDTKALLAEVSESNSYTNNQYVPGAGYYHAPYHGFYSYPYNHYNPDVGYYHGGQWTREPHQSDVTVSQPTPEAAQAARVRAGSTAHGSSAGTSSSVSRGGFGHSAHHVGA
jgi:hypothetical protein